MGELAANLTDRIFLTDEESYNEYPDKIRAMVRQGIEKTKKSHKMTEVADRRQAISRPYDQEPSPVDRGPHQTGHLAPAAQGFLTDAQVRT